MFARLAKFHNFGLWPAVPRREAVRLQPLHCNDNQPSDCRPEGRGSRPRQTLSCHWSLSRDGQRLECRWEAAADPSSASPGRVPRRVGPSPLAARDPARPRACCELARSSGCGGHGRRSRIASCGSLADRAGLQPQGSVQGSAGTRYEHDHTHSERGQPGRRAR